LYTSVYRLVLRPPTVVYMGCFPRSKVSGKLEFDPSRFINVEIESLCGAEK